MAANVRDAGALAERGDAPVDGAQVGSADWTDVAQASLTAQFRALGRRVKACADRLEQPRAVHRLRIATRRADAGLRLFGPLLPPRRTERLRRRIRKLRRAAGQVRDVDVLLSRLSGESAERADVLPLLSELRDCRSNRANALLQRLESRGTGRIRRQSRKVIERTRWRESDSDENVNGAGPHFLRPVLDEFRAAANADLTNVADLHQFRKCAKRLRYSVELLISATGSSSLQPVQAALEALQDRLGGINDHATATSVLRELACGAEDPHVVAAAESQLAKEQAAFDAERDRFLGWWRAGGAASLLGQLP